MHRAKPGSGAKETNNVDTKITLDQRPRHVSGHLFKAHATTAWWDVRDFPDLRQETRKWPLVHLSVDMSRCDPHSLSDFGHQGRVRTC